MRLIPFLIVVLLATPAAAQPPAAQSGMPAATKAADKREEIGFDAKTKRDEHGNIIGKDAAPAPKTETQKLRGDAGRLRGDRSLLRGGKDAAPDAPPAFQDPSDKLKTNPAATQASPATTIITR